MKVLAIHIVRRQEAFALQIVQNTGNVKNRFINAIVTVTFVILIVIPR